MNTVILAKDDNDEKTALELTPEIIEAVKSDSQQIHPQVEEAKSQYISQSQGKSLEENSEVLEQIWNDYVKAIGKLPKTIHESYPDFETWFQQNKNFLVTWFDQHFTTPKNPNPFHQLYSQQEQPIDEETFIRERIAPSIYYKMMALDKFSNIGLDPSKQTQNPITDFNNLMASYSRGIANHFIGKLDQIHSTPDKTATFIIGYPGAGKSSILEFENPETDNPIRQTKHGILIDPDEFQPLLPGYSSGARSQDVLIYAKQLIAKKIQDEALDKGISFANPQVGGQSNILAKDIAEALLHGFKVKVILKPTSKEESQRRLLSRSVAGGRVIMPLLGKTDPIKSFEELKENPELIKQKIVTELKQKIKTGNTNDIISNQMLDESQINDLLSNVTFIVANDNVTSSSFALKLIRLANKFESNNLYYESDILIDLSNKLLGTIS